MGVIDIKPAMDAMPEIVRRMAGERRAPPTTTTESPPIADPLAEAEAFLLRTRSTDRPRADLSEARRLLLSLAAEVADGRKIREILLREIDAGPVAAPPIVARDGPIVARDWPASDAGLREIARLNALEDELTRVFDAFDAMDREDDEAARGACVEAGGVATEVCLIDAGE